MYISKRTVSMLVNVYACTQYLSGNAVISVSCRQCNKGGEGGQKGLGESFGDNYSMSSWGGLGTFPIPRKYFDFRSFEIRSDAV